MKSEDSATAVEKKTRGYFQHYQCMGVSNAYFINMVEYGSDAYLDMVSELSQYKLNAQTYTEAIQRIMRDVNAYQGQISSPNFKNLGQRFAEYVRGKTGVDFRESHYFRNELNGPNFLGVGT